MNKLSFVLFLMLIQVAVFSQEGWYPIDRGLSDFAIVKAITQKDSRIYVGGQYFAVNGENSFEDIFLSTDNYSWNAPACPSFTFQAINDIEVYGDDLIVGGAFPGIGGDDELANLAIWDGNSWQSVGGGLNGTVNAILVREDKVYVGGNFTNAGGNPDADRVAYWDGDEWHALGKGISGSVLTLEWGNDQLYVGGAFNSVDGGDVLARGIARWDGEQWHPLTDACHGFGPNSVVQSLLFHDDQLYVGGQFFRNCPSHSNHSILRYLGTTYEELGSDLSSDNIYAIGVHQGVLYIGGSFENAGNDPDANFVARWNGLDWENIGISPNGDVYSIFSTGDKLYIGGDFNDLNQNPFMDGIAWHGVFEPPYLQYCDNAPDITAIESLLLSTADYEDRQDYYEYTVENEICDASDNAPCTFDDVWSLLKSDVSYQIPIREDYEALEVRTPYVNLEKSFLPPISYNPVPIMDCAEVVVPNLINQIAVMTTLTMFSNEFQADCPTLQNSLVPRQDTLLLKVDETRKCVTSYTRSGHLMYSGKVERCVRCDESGGVFIVTKGQGFSACGDNDIGAFLSQFNELRVSGLYDKVDARMAEEF
ncbi:hypothetical protein [Phaeodactylibacter xiamenensis]|uniref:hypothetical protein n=1 Tax=Phaeodactylibacter xiamenensis TaxID=1524460 RepID=UPI0024A85C83|nr:hypothetical protein [Phaeodactylibacter xiamenensis]